MINFFATKVAGVFLLIFSQMAFGATAETKKAMSEVSASAMRDHIAYLSGAKPLPDWVGLGPNVRISNRYDAKHIRNARAYLFSALTRYGFKEVQTEQFSSARPENGLNLYVDLPGQNAGQKGESIVVVGAHYDSFGRIPGADDNASGVASVLEAARILSRMKFKPMRTIRFLLIDAEEIGNYMGARHHFENSLKQGNNVAAFINMDMIAYSPGGGDYVMYDSKTNSMLSGLIQKVNRDSGLKFELDFWKGFESDFEAAHEYGIPSIAISEDPRDRKGQEIVFNEEGLVEFYHTKDDNMRIVNSNYAAKVTRLVMAMTVEVAQGSTNYSESGASAKQSKAAKRKRSPKPVFESLEKGTCSAVFL